MTQQRLYPELGDVRMECDTGLSGTVITDSHVRLDNKSNFRKIPGLERAHDGTNVTKVHMIYMNHCKSAKQFPLRCTRLNTVGDR